MRYLRRFGCFILAWMLLLSCAPFAVADMRAVRLENPTEDDPLYGPALHFFEENEETLRAAAVRFLESAEEGVTFSYYNSSKNDEKEAHVFRGINSGIGELYDEEYLALANCAKSLPVRIMSSDRNGANIEFKYYYFDSADFLRVHESGYYYIPMKIDESAALEDVLADCMPEQWSLNTALMDEYQLVRLTDDFIYYHWHG